MTRAQSFPGNISFSEQAGFRAARADIATIVTAHEVAHQWWGHRLMPGLGPGADVLIEGLANDSTLLFLQEERGPEARMDFARRLEARFLETRRLEVESPLPEIVLSTPRIERQGSAVRLRLRVANVGAARATGG